MPIATQPSWYLGQCEATHSGSRKLAEIGDQPRLAASVTPFENGATAVTQLPPRLADPGETMEHRPDDLVDPMGDTSASIGEATGMLGRVERSALDDTQH